MFRFIAGENIAKNSESPVKIEDDMFDLLHKGNDKAIYARINKGTSVNLRNDNDQTLLHYALLYNQLKIAQFLIDVGADLDAKDKFGQTARDVIQKHNSVLYNQPDDGISNALLYTEQTTVEKSVLGSSEGSDFFE